MKLTIGMASYKNFQEVWDTVQTLIMYHDLSDTEILIVDNYGDEQLEAFVRGWWHSSPVRYLRYTERQGTAAPRNKVFEEARGEWVICIDSHVKLAPGSIARFRSWAEAHPDCRDLLQGPLLYDDQKQSADAWDERWDGSMLGVWRNAQVHPESDPYEIPMMGLGLFGCRRDAWLGFNPDFSGFGGEEYYIHQKYKKAGRKTLCLPWLKWLHWFNTREGVCTAPYTPQRADIISNYEIGFAELGLDPEPMRRHFGVTTAAPAPPKIRNVQIDTNAACGSRCWFCPVRYLERPAGQVMPQAQFEKILDMVAAAVQSGEVAPGWNLWLSSYNDLLLDPLLEERLKALRARSLRFSLLSNGIGLQKHVDLVHDYRDVIGGISVNLPAGNAESYARHAGGSPETFEHIVEGLRELHAKDPVRYGAMSVCINGAYDDQPGLKYQLEPGDSERQRDDLARQLPGYQIHIMRPLADRAGHLAPYALDNGARPAGMKCDNGGNRLTEWLHINSFGQLYLCCQDYQEETVYADLREMRLPEALKQDKNGAMGKMRELCGKCCFNR